MTAARSRIWLLLVGFVGHAPGLWLFFRRSIPPPARRENLLAVLATLVAVAAAWLAGLDWHWLVAIWLAGHLGWGARLAWLLRR